MSESLVQQWNSVNGDERLLASQTYSGGQKIAVTESIPQNSTDLQLIVTLDVTAVKAIYILSDVAMLLEPNSGSAPDDPITLVAGVPYIWNTDSYDALFFGADWTSIYITTGAVGAGTLKIRAITDVTP